ncbi:hypothetical protein PHB09_148 [Pseudomonas phage PHB09]|uniref:Uncharacterized protein n=1 Tax=Pseudomonas phage PHB09 TaxID=2867265 RepID=A0AAE9BMT1_9CAUD|nr:hypothetical protein QGX10_gp147 [Pseudomonas phage PHB09]UAV84643.1 hypothetical protein PHB09_148 [Pseudomonas phage PHB09]
MARKITTEAVNAFMFGQKFNKDNTSVFVGESGTSSMHLHGNLIARRFPDGKIEVGNAGWFSNTTKERLNGLPGVSICQKKGVWFLNGEEWDGSWTTV